MFVQGSRDAFGTPAELQLIISQFGSADLFVVEGGDHSFKVPKTPAQSNRTWIAPFRIGSKPGCGVATGCAALDAVYSAGRLSSSASATYTRRGRPGRRRAAAALRASHSVAGSRVSRTRLAGGE